MPVSPPVIAVRSVSKRFTLHQERPRSFQELALAGFRQRRTDDPFWALRDVTFDVPRGQAFGIIGENGSGKSTLLKILAGILRPTSGAVSIDGRVAALLELGAGFHPDLTGRENAYLNGSILGLSRAEMDAKIDAIVDFAELERFIDTPLKHYSSGMQVRLGFAIAVVVDPDVLIADEVLSVGDEAFQRKCLARIQDLLQRGKTIVLVSHALELVRNLCTSAVWLDRGRVVAVGGSIDVIDTYMEHEDAKVLAQENADATGAAPDEESPRRWGSREVELIAVELLDDAGAPTTTFHTGGPMTARLHYLAHHPVERPRFGIGVYFGEHLWLSGPNTTFAGVPIERVEGPGVVDFRVKALPLLRGLYLLSAVIYDEQGVHAYDHHDRTYRFNVTHHGINERFGMVWLDGDWRHEPCSKERQHQPTE